MRDGTSSSSATTPTTSGGSSGGPTTWSRLFAARGDRVTLVGITRGPGPAAHDPAGAYRVEALHDRWRPPALAHRPRSPRDRLDLAARGRDVWRSAAQRRGAARLSELFAAARPGAVVIVAQVWAMEWVRLADTSGLRVVGMTHESYEATRRSSRHGRVREHYAHADRLLALTAEDADAWARAGMTNADHIPNPLHVEPVVYPTLDLPAVACVGRLSDEKGVDLLLEAWKRARERRPGWRLHVYGTGPDEEALRRRAAEAGLAGSVEFRGVVADVEDALVEVSIFVLRRGPRVSRCRCWRPWPTGCRRWRSTARRGCAPCSGTPVPGTPGCSSRRAGRRRSRRRSAG
ncbi:hypothetical protein BJF79_28615 [Actinomadura sp. CNU-125]|nr:glycosyltransferase [Actinomadura sp. CNU-125]OLT37903.1 hypothetical protein BJF79_28615 [Actinomadura sp. CNU-125]